MKKLLALALILTLALSATVFAAEIEINSKNGVQTFDPTTNSQTTVAVSATVGTILHRYAVDLEYTPLVVTVSGSTMVWNVQTFKYDVTSAGTAPTDAERTANVTFKNRSDKPIDIKYAITDATNEDYLTVSVQGCTEGETYTVDKATAAVGSAPGSTKDRTFVLEVTAKDTANADANEDADWASAAAYYADYFTNNSGETSKTIATIAFTVSMTPDPVTP